MASTSTSALLFILSLLFATASASAATNTTTPHTTHKQTNITTLHTTHKQAQLSTIIDAIIGASDFTSWSKLLSGSDISTIPLSATVFIPISPSATAFVVENSNSPVLLPYHIIRRRFSFAELQLFPTGTRLPTLLPGTTLCITNNSAVNFTVNGDKLTEPDLFQNDIVCVHGVEGLLHLSNLTLSPPMPSHSVGFKGSDASKTRPWRPRRYRPRVRGRKPPRVWGRRPRFVWVSGGVSGSYSWVRVIVGLVLPCIMKGIFGITIYGV